MSVRNIFVIVFFTAFVILLAFFSRTFIGAGQTAVILQGDSLLQKEKFGNFFSINSVREHRGTWIEDQYQVADFHRVFGMDSYVFTGEEIITSTRGVHFKVDPSIPHDEYPNDKIGFNPAKGAGKFDFDKFLMSMRDSDLKTIPVLARNLLYANIPRDSIINVWQIPYDNNGNPENPLHYKAYSSFLYQFTARYGRNKLISEGGTISRELIKVSQGNDVRAGLNLVFGIEPGNEMDKEWFSKSEYASPKELAAFLSAAIDGHMGLMGAGHGILTADSTMKILLPSPTDIKYSYVSEVLRYLKTLRATAVERGYEIFPSSNFIFTAHSYPFDKNRLTESSTTVENTSIFDRSYSYVMQLGEEYDCPVYLTETGYDKATGFHSPIGVPVNATDSIDVWNMSTSAHAKHLLRLLLTSYAAGFDKTFLFTLKDPVAVDEKNFSQKFATSGLVKKTGAKEHSWYCLKYLARRLSDHELTFAYIDQPINFLVMENDHEFALMYWLGSNSNKTSFFQLPSTFCVANESQLINLDDPSTNSDFGSVCVNTCSHSSLPINEFPQLLIIPK